jgi:hypothetical protein
MPSTFSKYGEIPHDRVYYDWLEKCCSKSISYDRVVYLTFAVIAVCIFIFGLYLSTTSRYGMELAIIRMVEFLFGFQFLITIIDYLVIIPNGKYMLGLDEVLSTPIRTSYLLNDLKQWVRDFNARHRRPMVIIAWAYILVATFGPWRGYDVNYLWIPAIMVYIYWLVVHEFLQKSSMLIIIFQNTKGPISILVRTGVVPLLVLSIITGPMSWYFSRNFYIYTGIHTGYWTLFSLVSLLIPAVLLARMLPSIMEKRRQGIFS